MVFITVLCILSNNVALAATTSEDKDVEYLRSVMEMIKEKYKGNVTDEQLIEGALKGMFGTMDPYTVYWTPEEAESFLSSMDGSFGGIGISMEIIEDYIVAMKVFSNSPAEKAGITAGDKIVEANGKNLIGASLEEAGATIRGEIGTKVTLGVIKKGTTEVTKMEVTRDLIKVNPVSYSIYNDIGYIKIDSFNSNTAENIEQALKEIDNKNIEKVILDLRNNPGGLVDQAVAVARKFVPEGLITKLDYKSSSYNDEEFRSYLKTPKYKLVVLVNEMSASASEILAGAIQDTNSGTLVGTKTFGKAKVQVVIPILTAEAYAKYEKQVGTKLVDAYELIYKHGITPLNSEIIGQAKITVGEYTTPNGRMIDGQGLRPDYNVINKEQKKYVDFSGISKLSINLAAEYPTEGLDVYNAERILKIAGYEVDAPDLIMDDKTKTAISKFQEDSGLVPVGLLDFSTQDALNRKLDKLVTEFDEQYSLAIGLLKDRK